MTANPVSYFLMLWGWTFPTAGEGSTEKAPLLRSSQYRSTPRCARGGEGFFLYKFSSGNTVLWLEGMGNWLGLPAGMKTVRKIAVIVFSLQRRNSKWQTERARAPCCPGGVFFCLVLTQLTVITTTGALSSRPGTRSMISSKYLVSDVYECVRLSCDEEGI